MEKVARYIKDLFSGRNVSRALKKLSKQSYPKEWFLRIVENPKILVLNAQPCDIRYIKKICENLDIPFDDLPLSKVVEKNSPATDRRRPSLTEIRKLVKRRLSERFNTATPEKTSETETTPPPAETVEVEPIYVNIPVSAPTSTKRKISPSSPVPYTPIKKERFNGGSEVTTALSLTEIAKLRFLNRPILLLRFVGYVPFHLIEGALWRLNFKQLRYFRQHNVFYEELIEPMFHAFLVRDFPHKLNDDFEGNSYACICDELYLRREIMNNIRRDYTLSRMHGRTDVVIGTKSVDDVPETKFVVQPIRPGLSRIRTSVVPVDPFPPGYPHFSEYSTNSTPTRRIYVQCPPTPISHAAKRAPLFARYKKNLERD